MRRTGAFFQTGTIMITFFIICPLVFLAGFVDSIGGGGGLISLPAYLLAGLPAHQAIATNKLSSACGTALSTVRFARQKLIHWRSALPVAATALAGSWIGANLSLMVDTRILTRILYVVLPLTALLVFKKDIFMDHTASEQLTPRTIALCALISFVVGMYDGFYGPGTGTFLIIAFSAFAKLDVRSANGLCKAVNLTTNVTSLMVFLTGGQVRILLGLTAAACNMAGNWIGSGMALKKGARITRPIILFVLGLLLAAVIRETL